MSFHDDLRQRSAAVYADFFADRVPQGARLLDCGCGSGSITVGLEDEMRLTVDAVAEFLGKS